jgi:hypothetical protein
LEDGFSYIAIVPQRFRWPLVLLDDGPGRESSRLVLAEDTVPLGPAHAPHADIRTKGGGRFSHWTVAILFSSSDNSDPRTNGRLYTLTVRPLVSADLLRAAAVLATLAVVLFGPTLFSATRRIAARALFAAALAGLVGAVVVASGWIGRVALGPDEPKDAALVWSLLWHAGVGMLVTFVQCGLSIAVGRLLFRRQDLPASHALLYGFPASLALLALGSLATLTVPAGGMVTIAIFALLFLSLRRDAVKVTRWGPLVKRLAALSLPAAAFGIWLGLLWHGPTATLPGWPAGDQVFYTTLVTTLAFDPWPLRNWGSEGEAFSGFNLLWPAIGAALSKGIQIEPFAFVVTAGATAFMLCTAIVVRAYILASASRAGALGVAVLGLGLVVAGRYPFWVVESPPMIHAVALTIAIWFWVTQARGAPLRVVGATAAAVIGTALTKVVGAATLVPLTMGAIVPELRSAPPAVRILVLVTGAILAAAATWLLVTFAPRLLAVGSVGLEGYVWMVKWGTGFRDAEAYVLRDIGTGLLTIAAFILAPWWTALPIAFGLLIGLIVPFTMFAARISAVVLIVLVAFENPDRLGRARLVVVPGLALCLPAMFLADPGGWLTGVVWVVCMVAAVRAAFGGVAASPPVASAYATDAGDLTRYTPAVLAVAMALFLIAVARGQVGLASNWAAGKHKLTPEVRELWHAVPEVVPRDALVFTDQTGSDWGLLGGWNTYAFHGKRQLFISTWVQSGELQADPEKRAAKLRWNDQVLDGSAPPTAVPLRGKYGTFYAAVDRRRVPVLVGWAVVREVGPFAILRWEGKPAVAPESRP